MVLILAVAATFAKANWKATARTVNVLPVKLVRAGEPEVCVAVIVTPVAAFGKARPDKVRVVPFAEIVPVVVPARLPAMPFEDSEIPVLVRTPVAMPALFCDWMVTEKGVPMTGDAGVMAVMTK